jgi:TBC1 domain family protein 5
LLLWDGIFAEDPSLRIIEFISIAMLLRIRDALLASDYSGFLHLLLRYPAPDDGDHRVSLLLQQAISLRDSVSALTGAQCRAENIALGATAGVASGDDDDSWRRSGTPTSSKQEGASAASLLADGGGFVGDLAKGVFGRAEALGINKALFGTFNEIRVSRAGSYWRDSIDSWPQRNVNGQQAPISERLSRIDRSGTPSSRDYMAEIARLKSANLAMGKAVERCVNVLERQWSIGESSELRQGEGEALMALTGLKHVSDVLRGVATIFDPNVLDSLSAPTVQPSIDVETVLQLPPADVAPTPATTSVKPTPLPTSPIAPPSRVASPAQPRGHVRALSTEPSRMHGSPVAAPPPPWVATSSPTFLPRLPPSISFPTSSTPATPRSRDSSPVAKGGAGGGFPTTQFTTRPAPSATRARRVGRTEVVDPLGAGLL